MTDLVALRGVQRVFSQKLDAAAHLLNLFGGRYRPISVHAVDGVDLTIRAGEVLAVVGESGCGKSTLGRMVTGILPPSAGTMLFEGHDVTTLGTASRRDWTRRIQMVFQDPMSSLNPRRRVRDIIGEAPLVHGLVKRAEIDAWVDDMLIRVGLSPDMKFRLPHEFSGGQRQRIGIARALAVRPSLLVCDEAVAALDVSIQAQILNLFLDLKDALGLTYLFISHNLAVVHHLADRVAIMYLGRIVELASTEALFAAPAHPYTQSLLRDIPRLDRRAPGFAPLGGEAPSPRDRPAGCHFHPRCPVVLPICRTSPPPLIEVAPERVAACHRVGGISGAATLRELPTHTASDG